MLIIIDINLGGIQLSDTSYAQVIATNTDVQFVKVIVLKNYLYINIDY